MSAKNGMVRWLAAVACLGLAAQATVWAQAESERFRSAKMLYYDSQYAEARRLWQAVVDGGRGTEVDAAAYHVARCSESLGELERALGEYGAFLARKSAETTLVEEAKLSRAGLAARLVKEGKREHLGVLKTTLTDPSKTIRYYTAFRLAGLGGDAAAMAVPVLERIVRLEKDKDLVDRAKLALLNIDPQALARTSTPPPPDPPVRGKTPKREATWVKVRIYDKGAAKPNVSLNLPVALAELVFKSLPDDARQDLKAEGYDAARFWEHLKRMGPTEILSIDNGDGGKIQIWIE